MLNLGGIVNITLLPASGRLDEVIGFDSGPANMPLDAVMRLTSNGIETYDHNGDYAARGRVDPILLEHLLAHPFVRQAPPRRPAVRSLETNSRPHFSRSTQNSHATMCWRH